MPITTQSFGYFLKMFLVLLMAVTSNAPLLPICMVYIEIGKGFSLQNCLFALFFNMYFTYSLCGWEGATSDICVFADAKAHDFIVTLGKYYLADTGFPVCDELLTPYCAVLYVTIWLSGAMLVSGEWFIYIYNFY
jgi:hypothetical protein